MHCRWITCFLALTFAAATAEEAQISQIKDPRQTRERATSSSGQFLIYGDDGKIRSQFARDCEKARKDFAAVIGLPKGWYYPVVVEIHSKPLQRVERRTLVRAFPIEPNGFRFQLDILQDEDFKSADFEKAMIRLLILEQMFYPPNRKITQDKIPPWVLAGIEELVSYHRHEVPTDIFASLIESHQILPVREVLTTSPQDLDNSVTRKIYRACAAALVQALLDQGDGQVRFRVFLQDLAVEKADSTELLERHFAAMRQDYTGLEKWWALQMAAMSQKSVFEYLNIAETEKQLEQALQVRFDNLPEQKSAENFSSRIPSFREIKRRFDSSGKDFTSGSLRDFEQFANHPRLGDALKVTSDQLANIQNRAFPLYIPVIAGYNKTMALLLEGKTREVAERMEFLEIRRRNIRSQMTQVTDFMNWYDATQIEEESDDFESYERALIDIEKLDRRKRTDPISGYLDAMEKEFAD
tara:strand:- start:160 stop:1566 length:1407 start_codon:yes stop_codon:yes gene_type:complete